MEVEVAVESRIRGSVGDPHPHRGGGHHQAADHESHPDPEYSLQLEETRESERESE